MLKGKALMLSMKLEDTWHTFAWATAHSIDMNAQTADLATKDNYGGVQLPEVTGISWTLKTDNLVESRASGVKLGFSILKQVAQNRDEIDIRVSYFEAAERGESYQSGDNDWESVDVGHLVLSGKVIITNLTMNAPNKERATWSATFTGKGAFEVNLGE